MSFYLGLFSGILILSSFVSYIFGIIRGTTKPNRATWFMLSAISLLIATSYYDLGAKSTFWPAASVATGTVVVALLAIRFGSGGWNWLERVCIAACSVSAIFYMYSDSPLTILILSLLMDGAALVPTMRHAIQSPHEEDKTAWTLTLIADALAVAAIDQWHFSIIVYPLYMVIVNGIIVVILFRFHFVN